jgi:alanyl-tRNA synthetase
MKAADIRQRFLEYFARNGHVIRPSSSLVPADDPTLLFTNAGMVPFKRIFLGEEKLPFKRAVTSQKCLRVSGKHNDLEEVGVTSRHHTFFEMLGNFSFGDYFKRDAVRFAWELITEEYGLPKDRLWATVHYSDDEAASLWQEIAGLPASRIFRLGDKDNFWQMGETGPCGPCSEIHFDLRAEGRGTEVTVEEFEVLGAEGQFLELWNLVFMQYDRSADGTLTPLPAPSIDTGAGLERLASVLQNVGTNYATDLFTPLIERAAQTVGKEYRADEPSGVSYRVLADHARAVTFLVADGVFPSNEGRGYVLRRILRRAVRHAWLLGRREPTLVHVADRVIDEMSGAYAELRAERTSLLRVIREEEQRFLETIDSGMQRFDELAPVLPAERREDIEAGQMARPTVNGADAFRLHDTFGFPLDLTELIARERGYVVDTAGFDAALEEQRQRSRQDRKSAGVALGAAELSANWKELDPAATQEFVGYDRLEVETDVIAVASSNGRAALQLRGNPFYAEAGGQISDAGIVQGDGWHLTVEDVRRLGDRVAVLGSVEGALPAADAPFAARATVPRAVRRDTQRNHTATHLLHAALRKVLGPHVLQRGSLVAPDRLRFDFAHPRPMSAAEIRQVEDEVNSAILEDIEVRTELTTYPEAVARGAMALFGEKYGDVVRLVQVPDVSMELCGGTHVRHTGEIGLFRVVSESGVASGVRRIEAVTGSGAYRRSLEHDALLEQTAALLRTPVAGIVHRVEQLGAEAKELRRQLEKARVGAAGDIVADLLSDAISIDGVRVVVAEVTVETAEELRALGDRLRERIGSGAAIVAGRQAERVSFVVVVSDDLLGRGVRADRLVREIAQLTGGTGGGRPHMAQGGAGDATRVRGALDRAPDIVRSLLTDAA